MAYIHMIELNESQGELREIYMGMIESRGKLAEVHKIQSLNPTSITRHMDLYLHLMFGKSPLKRYQREMLGVVTSKYNNCNYCITHHAEALNHFWKDHSKVDALILDHRSTDISVEDLALCNYAEQLTVAPDSITQVYTQDELRLLGLEDRDILDATLIISYFNFVNRMVLGLGVQLEADQTSGYKYD